MLKKLICAGVAASALPCYAETWHFEFQGFQDTAAGMFRADRKLTGSFVGQDSDGDGTIARGEITTLVLNGFDYVACEGTSNDYYHCGAEAFSYTLGGALTFTAAQYGSDPEGWVGGGHSFIAGDGEYGYDYRPGAYNEWSHLWTTDTTFVISSAPEPATWALLLAGIPLAMLASRRRRK